MTLKSESRLASSKDINNLKFLWENEKMPFTLEIYVKID